MRDIFVDQQPSATHLNIGDLLSWFRLNAIGFLFNRLLCGLIVLAGLLITKTAFAHHSGTTFTVSPTDMTLASNSVREGVEAKVTLRGTYSPRPTDLSAAHQDDILAAVRAALKFSGTASAADVIYSVADAAIEPSAGTFEVTAGLAALDDGIKEGTETLTLTFGTALKRDLKILDAPEITITARQVSFSQPDISEGETSRLVIDLRHDAGVIETRDQLDFLVNAIIRARNTITFGGSASRGDRNIEVPRVGGLTVGGYDPLGGENYLLPVGQARIYLDVSAKEDNDTEGPETVIASVLGKSATLVIFDKDDEIAPYLQIMPASPAVTGPIGARMVNFKVTNIGTLTGEPFPFNVRVQGPVVGPHGADAGNFVKTLSFPSGPNGQSMALTLALDEARLKAARTTVSVSIAPAAADQDYQVGSPGRASIDVTSHAEVTERTRQVISRHMNRVAALITADTGRARLRDRQQARAVSTANGPAYRLGGHVSERRGQLAGNVAFESSTDRVRGATRAAERDRIAALGIDATKYSLGRTNAARPAPAWDVWVSGKYSYERTGKGAERSTGHAGLMRAGTDYLLNPETLIGIMAQYDTSRDRSNQQGFEVSGHGWMVGPYLEMQLSKNIYFDAKVLGGKSSNEVSPFATYTDSFDTTRWLTSARLTGYWTFGAWQFTPSAEFVSYQDRQASYTDSNGLLIDGQTLRVNRLNVGPEISRAFTTSEGVTIAPRLALRGLWRFGGKRTDMAASGSRIAIDPIELDGFLGRLEAGLQIRTPGGVSVDLDGSYDGIGSSERSGASISGRVRIPLQ